MSYEVLSIIPRVSLTLMSDNTIHRESYHQSVTFDTVFLEAALIFLYKFVQHGTT